MASIGMCMTRFCIMMVCLPSRLESFDPRAASIFVDTVEIFESTSDPGTLVRREDVGLDDVGTGREVDVEETRKISRARWGRPLR